MEQSEQSALDCLPLSGSLGRAFMIMLVVKSDSQGTLGGSGVGASQSTRHVTSLLAFSLTRLKKAADR